jgi:hypothetical protein
MHAYMHAYIHTYIHTYIHHVARVREMESASIFCNRKIEGRGELGKLSVVFVVFIEVIFVAV